jgi:4-hydroxybenzoate polyprenyltransferase
VTSLGQLEPVPNARGSRPPGPVSRIGGYLAERFGVQLVAAQLLMYGTAVLYGKAIVTDGALDIRLGDLAGGVALVMFFLLARVFDEHKDYEFDVLHLADRPLPRGAVSWREVDGLGILAVLVGIATSVTLDRGVGAVCAWWTIAIAYLVLTRYEFFVRSWLRRHFVTNTITHLPVYALASVWAAEIGAHPTWVTAAAGWLAAYTYLHTFGADLWRKSRAPEDERAAIDTYTRRWGTTGASVVTAGTVILSGALGAAMLAAAKTGTFAGYLALTLAPLPVLVGLVSFVRDPSAKTDQRRRRLLALTLVALQAALILTIAIDRGLT